jgi:hypothetical protein
MQFTIEDIKDKDRLEQMIKKEALSIFNSKKANEARSLDDIEFTVRQGKIAELYLIENCGYKEADKRWHDLIDSRGNYIEVKAYTFNGRVLAKNTPFVQRDLHRLRNATWNDSKWYILFRYEDGIYTLLEKIQI